MLEVDPALYHSHLTCNRENIFANDSWLSKSAISEFASGSPYVWRYYPKQYESKAMAHGTLIDTLTTTPELFDEEYVVSPYPLEREVKGKLKTISTATNEAKEWAESQTRRVITREQKAQAEQAAEMLLEHHPISKEIFASSKKQVILKVTKEEFSAAGKDWCKVNLKALLDLVPSGNFLCDLKTTHTLTKSAIEKAIANFDYHAQAGMYLSLWNLLNPDDQRHNFKFIFQCSKPPFEVAVVELSRAEINAGIEYIKHYIKRLQRYAKRDFWPMLFDNQVEMVSRPNWAMFEEDEELNR